MTIDEAIAHENELAKKSYMQGMLCHANPDDEKLDEYIESGKYHEQISEWLEELKSYRSARQILRLNQTLERNGMGKIVLTVFLWACEIATIGVVLWLIKDEL